MDTAYGIELLRGVHAAELLRRGFKPIGRVKDDIPGDDLELEDLDSPYDFKNTGNRPIFLWSSETRSTYALDEAGTFWSCEGYIDLSDLGFEKEPNDGGEEPSVH